jgi:hypothetical protein
MIPGESTAVARYRGKGLSLRHSAIEGAKPALPTRIIGSDR